MKVLIVQFKVVDAYHLLKLTSVIRHKADIGQKVSKLNQFGSIAISVELI